MSDLDLPDDDVERNALKRVDAYHMDIASIYCLK